jgi:REP element-mobilizing transposase RayT
MSHTYISNVMHCVFSTKDRAKQISPELQNVLWPYMGGIARTNGIKPVAIGGMEDHCHLLLALPSDISISKALQLVKGGSSKWFRETHLRSFAWQQGYGAFSVSASQLPKTIAYIQNQAKHHKRIDFAAEFVLLLKRHGIEYDPKYVLG